MEFMSRPQERENPSPEISPNSNGGGGTNSLSNNINSNGVQIPTPPLTPKPTPPQPRSDSNPYPTTFVQADTSNFKHVVQMLTGSSETVKQTTTTAAAAAPNHHHHHHHHPHHHQDQTAKNYPIPPIRTAPKKQGFKLYERRNNLKNSLMINTLVGSTNNPSSGFSPRSKPEILSPSILDFPSLTLSPVTPLNQDPFDKSSASPSMPNSSSSSSSSSSEEDRAIAEKGFYLHPSPRTLTPRDSQPPQLLSLFPVTSPKVSSG